MELSFPGKLWLQWNVHRECQLEANGVTEFNDPRRESLKSGIKDWILLLQINSDAVPDTEWGDTGRIYYFIRKQDLEKLDFNKVWLIMQCT
ncbi:MAG: DUF1963 domain-containing protein [Chloroflexi bacterium]|uniref:DUF1963 domain-containing protein n=1 Tax=Candidatus Chlorohelix allophototropha TaxID=3003348 RepID=A0A8T7M3F3_9CHLR|nr:DUF1963 domain-containing protein [Chloroflexota bacterium]